MRHRLRFLHHPACPCAKVPLNLCIINGKHGVLTMCLPISKPLVHINSFNPYTNTMCYYCCIYYYSTVQMRKLKQRAVNNLLKDSTSSRAKIQLKQLDVLITPMPVVFKLGSH